MAIETIIFLTAFFHAVAAAIQQMFRKKVLDVASTYQVAAGIFVTATAFLFVTHLVVTGEVWHVGGTSSMFWGVMAVFVIANTTATLLSLSVLQGESLSGATVSLLIAAGLLALGDITFFGDIPTTLQVMGIGLLIVSFVLLGKFSGASPSSHKGTAIAKAFAAMCIYNFVTPVTNKYCAQATSATFSSWVAHASIAATLLAVCFVRSRYLGDSWRISTLRIPPRGFFLGISILGCLTATSNGLLSWSFELGGSIPAALMMKRALPPIMVLLFVVMSDRKAGRTTNWREAGAIVVAAGGTGMMV